MTRASLQINRLAYLGPDKPVAHVNFSSGLNIVCGASETGKSFIVDTIDFMFGGQRELRDLPERVGYDRIVMWIALSNGNKFTVQRSMQGGGYRWRVGHHDRRRVRGRTALGRGDQPPAILYACVPLAKWC